MNLDWLIPSFLRTSPLLLFGSPSVFLWVHRLYFIRNAFRSVLLPCGGGCLCQRNHSVYVTQINAQYSFHLLIYKAVYRRHLLFVRTAPLISGLSNYFVCQRSLLHLSAGAFSGAVPLLVSISSRRYPQSANLSDFSSIKIFYTSNIIP